MGEQARLCGRDGVPVRRLRAYGHSPSVRSARSCPNCSTPTCATPAPASATTWPPSSVRPSYRPSPLEGRRPTGRAVRGLVPRRDGGLLSDRRGHLPRDQGRRFHQVTDGVCPNPQILTLRAVTFRSKRKDPLIRTKPPFPPIKVRISHPVCLRRSVSMRTSPSNISVAVLERAATVHPITSDDSDRMPGDNKLRTPNAPGTPPAKEGGATTIKKERQLWQQRSGMKTTAICPCSAARRSRSWATARRAMHTR